MHFSYFIIFILNPMSLHKKWFMWQCMCMSACACICDNYLELNTKKTKEMIVDLRKDG